MGSLIWVCGNRAYENFYQISMLCEFKLSMVSKWII